MTTEKTRETMKAYADALLAFGDYARCLSDDVTMTFMGTDRAVRGRDAVHQTIGCGRPDKRSRTRRRRPLRR